MDLGGQSVPPHLAGSPWSTGDIQSLPLERTKQLQGPTGGRERTAAAAYPAYPTIPNSPCFIIAHSHGGNIARYALHDPEFAARAAGVVTLATPFLTGKPRNVHPLVLLLCHGIFFFFAYYALTKYIAPMVVQTIVYLRA